MLQVDFSEELLNQIGQGDSGSPDRSIKFDDKGTVHIQYRNEDGKLIKDIPVNDKGLSKNKVDATNEEVSLKGDISGIEYKNKMLRIYFYALLFGSVLAVGLAICVFSILR